MKKCTATDKDADNNMQRKILNFLKKVDNDFPIPISQKTDLEEYAGKLSDNATIITMCENDEIVAMAAGYINKETRIAYISLLATLPHYRGVGMGKTIVKAFIEKSRTENMSRVHLYTHSTNQSAIKLYSDLGFTYYDVDERVGDKHLVYWLSGEKK